MPRRSPQPSRAHDLIHRWPAWPLPDDLYGGSPGCPLLGNRWSQDADRRNSHCCCQMAWSGVVCNHNGGTSQDAAVNPKVNITDQCRADEAFRPHVGGARAADHVSIRGGQFLYERCEVGPHLWLVFEDTAGKWTDNHEPLPDPVPAQPCVGKLLVCHADSESDLLRHRQVKPQKATAQGPEVLQGVTPQRRLCARKKPAAALGRMADRPQPRQPRLQCPGEGVREHQHVLACREARVKGREISAECTQLADPVREWTRPWIDTPAIGCQQLSRPGLANQMQCVSRELKEFQCWKTQDHVTHIVAQSNDKWSHGWRKGVLTLRVQSRPYHSM